ncbi:MAG: UDP-N-acetylmuramoyl-tripeptide--D-alanyl-D-alanine ligase [Lachnospiraceae bacterium]|nr:UDP-N-acetylmuramoyl-tripeptide--D-alanyl-D-alanine ligase [Lachnospiraceae bacterium]
MSGMTIERIVEACKGTYYGPQEALKEEISMITTDSRKIGKDYLFVAIKGERVDGNLFVSSAYADGALVCLSEVEAPDRKEPYIVVDSCFQALKDMAGLYREILGTKIIGITGSVGKTTTKEMVAAVLSERFCTLKTKGNFNNEVGVPLTLFRLRKEHEIAVVEMGISEFGEMTRLSQVVKPDACVITNVGQCHLENLGDRDGVLKAKTEIFTHMSENGNIYLNGDDDKLVTVTQSGERSITFFGIGGKNKVYADKIKNLGLKGTNFEAVTETERFSVHVPVPGKHMVSNALAAISIGLDLGMTGEEITRGIEKFRPIGGHSNIIETGKYTILDDCYNANPASMRAGIDVLKSALGRKVAILGDMFELGEEAAELHASVGRYAAGVELDVLIFVGELSGNALIAAEKIWKKKETLFYFSTREELLKKLSVLLEDGDTILVKASHGMHFEKIVDRIKEMS